MFQWYCVLRHPGEAAPVITNDGRRHWFGLSRVLIERNRSVVEVRAFRSRTAAERAFAGGLQPGRGMTTASLATVRAWFPFRACLRSLKPSARQLLAQRRAA